MNIYQMMAALSSGTLDARAEVNRMLQRMTPEQRRGIMGMVPKVESMAKKFGISTDGFQEDARTLINK